MSIKFGTNNKPTIEEKKLDLDAGVLGKFFGNSNSAPSNIAGLSILLLLIFSVFITIYPNEKISTAEVWKITSPIITLILGYLFGKSEKS